jgi:hypothetical protein
MSDDEYITDDELLIEAARYAIAQKIQREAFIKQAKQAWYKAAFEAGRKVRATLADPPKRQR